MHGTGNEDVVGVEEPYEVWCSALRALDLVNANNIPAVGRELSESGYLPNSLDLRNLGELSWSAVKNDSVKVRFPSSCLNCLSA